MQTISIFLGKENEGFKFFNKDNKKLFENLFSSVNPESIPISKNPFFKPLIIENDDVQITFHRYEYKFGNNLTNTSIVKEVRNKKESIFFETTKLNFTISSRKNEKFHTDINGINLNIYAKEAPTLAFYIANNYSDKNLRELLVNYNNSFEKLTKNEQRELLSLLPSENTSEKELSIIRNNTVYDWYTALKEGKNEINYKDIIKSSAMSHKSTTYISIKREYPLQSGPISLHNFSIHLRKIKPEKTINIGHLTFIRNKKEQQVWNLHSLRGTTQNKQTLTAMCSDLDSNNKKIISSIKPYIFSFKIRNLKDSELHKLFPYKSYRGNINFDPETHATAIDVINLPDCFKNFGLENKIIYKNNKFVALKDKHKRIAKKNQERLNEWGKSFSTKNIRLMRYYYYNTNTKMAKRMKAILSSLSEDWENELTNELVDLMIIMEKDMTNLAELSDLVLKAKENFMNSLEMLNNNIQDKKTLKTLAEEFSFN